MTRPGCASRWAPRTPPAPADQDPIAEPSVVQLTESLGNAAQGLPFTVIVDKTGVISRVKVGMLSEDDLDTTLGRLTRP